MSDSTPHVPVLLSHVLELFADLDEGLLIDGTLGAGGHSRALLEAHEGLKLLGIDRDPDAIPLASKNLEAFANRTRFQSARFSEFAEVLLDGEKPSALLLDVGVSSMQLDQRERGFSFEAEVPLDMRMEQSGETAADVIDRLSTDELADVLYNYGGERFSRKIAQWIKEARDANELETAKQLGQLCRRAYPNGKQRIHPATRSFQALRIAVNDELGELERALHAAAAIGEMVVAVIAFHSLEDRIVKTTFREWKAEGRGELLTKKPRVADYEEVQVNRRARSARLRAFRLGAPLGPKDGAAS